MKLSDKNRELIQKIAEMCPLDYDVAEETQFCSLAFLKLAEIGGPKITLKDHETQVEIKVPIYTKINHEERMKAAWKNFGAKGLQDYMSKYFVLKDHHIQAIKQMSKR
jgi:hypothetical protein